MRKNNNALIYFISENSRMTIKDIGVILKKSSPRLKYNIRALEKSGILKEHFTIFDYSYFGLILFRVYFKGGYISDADKRRIIDELEKNQYIIGIYELTGEYDLVVEFASPNPSRFNKELKNIASLKPTLSNYKIVLNLVTYIYPRDYLIRGIKRLSRENPYSELIIGGDRKQEDFTRQELAVIHSLLKIPSARLTRLADGSDINIRTLKRIMQNLSERKIMRGTKRLVGIHKLGINRVRLFLRLHNVSKRGDQEITEFMQKTKEIILLNKTVGDWDMEIDIETDDRAEARKIIQNIRQRFIGMIAGFNMMEFDFYYKRTYLPEFLFQDEKMP